jgi:hypothetical protein
MWRKPKDAGAWLAMATFVAVLASSLAVGADAPTSWVCMGVRCVSD